AGARARPRAGLHDASDRALRRGRDHGDRLPARTRRLALAGAAGVMSSYRFPVPQSQVGRPSAWWGMTILIASEATLFGTLIGTYYYLRFKTPTWPPGGIPEPKLVVPLVMLAVLVSTTVPMRLAATAARTGRLAATRLLIAVALVVQ